jgi:hypothetical protein
MSDRQFLRVRSRAVGRMTTSNPESMGTGIHAYPMGRRMRFERLRIAHRLPHPQGSRARMRRVDKV